MKIGMDLDGVLADFNKSFARLLDIYPDPKALVCWDWPKYFGCTDREIEAAWDQVRRSPLFWQTLSPLNFAALAAIRETQDEHDYLFLTAREGTMCREQTVVWLEQHGIKNPDVRITARKHEFDVDVMIDDRPENLVPFLWKRPVKLYLVDQPWNRSVWMPKVIRAWDAYTALRQCGALGEFTDPVETDR